LIVLGAPRIDHSGAQCVVPGAHVPGTTHRSSLNDSSTPLPSAAHALQRSAAEETMAKYGKSASKNVESAMRRRKRGTLTSGSGRKVTSRKQAIAIGLSEAREKGGKVPSRAGSSRSTAKRPGAKTSSRSRKGAKKR
jgi:hypothetical protein